jgi:hypothetical protein
MNVLSYVNLIRKEIGLEEIEPASDGVCGFLSEREVAEYIGKRNAKVLFREHNKILEEKYLKGELLEIQPVFVGSNREGLLLSLSDSIKYRQEVAYTVLVGSRYEIEMSKDYRRRVARVGELDRYEKYREKEDRILRKIGVDSRHISFKEGYEYLGVYKKKIVMRKKDSGEIMYYNAEEVFNF